MFAKNDELGVIREFHEVILYLTQWIEKIPRHLRYTLGADIERRINLVLSLLLRAKYRRESVDDLSDTNLELEILRYQVRQTTGEPDVTSKPVHPVTVPTDDEKPASQAEREFCMTMLKQSMNDMTTANVQPAKHAMDEIAAEFGLPLERHRSRG